MLLFHGRRSERLCFVVFGSEELLDLCLCPQGLFLGQLPGWCVWSSLHWGSCMPQVPSPWHQVLSKHVAQRQSMPRVVGVTLKWNGLQMLQKRGGRGQIKKHKCCWPGWWQWQPLSQQWSTGVFAKATYFRLPTFITDYGHQIVSLSLGFL